ncbi:hypothetical protein F4859DRAFT_59165 [Xylaria cf. heliscus]|nr:hypothetical protein F4859DRAFT_59165 [Xylaria cf. heliscus]
MKQQIIFLLGIMAVAQLSLASVLAASGRNYMANAGNGTTSNNSKEWASSSSHRAISVAKVVTAEPATVTVTITTIETTIVDTNVVPDTLDSSIIITNTSDITTDNQTVTITYTAVSGTDDGTSADTTSLSVNATPLFQRLGSTSSSSLQAINTDSVMMASSTITVVGSSSSTPSTTDVITCDDIFCNTDGNKICIYWGGMTSWDISLGPIPGERPTIIGTC